MPRTAARCRGLLLSAQGDHGSALITLKKALEEHERLPQPFELARTLLALGMVRRRAKQKRASRESLDRALELFGALGARLWIEKAKAELGRIGGRAAAPNDLTPTESRIAELVAQGSTNKEVARELFISVKTVEASLTRVYRKLGAASRRELARQVMEGPARGLQERARKGKTPNSES